jgi:hypothetical protein
LIQPVVEEDFVATTTTTTTHLDDDSPSNLCIHHQWAPIGKPKPCSYVADVKDHQEESWFLKA